ncbi:MAG: fibrobacter succinogenes major paralogous domain-containing protein [Bacteroidales bacterium]|nr:fibrobacter succinogenes major paralogous domain-containing protein [Bacteroidales bacterium]
MADVTDWSVAKFKITYHLSEGDIVSENAISPVPYALQAANNTDLSELLAAVNAKFDSLGHVIDSLSDVTPAPAPRLFICGKYAVTDHEGNVYNTVKIGSQCWMKVNMKTTKYANGTDIDAGKMFNPDNNANNVATYGLLYTWSAATRDSSTTYPEAGQVKVQGICPAGWHVLSDAEWDTLTTYVKGKSEYICGEGANNIANALADTTGWSSNTSSGCNAGNTGDKANLTGFSALPAGYYLGSFPVAFGGYAYFWSATENDDNNAWYRNLNSNDSNVNSNYDNKDNGYSDRCVRD